MELSHPTEEQIHAVWKEYGLTRSKLDESIKILKEWLKQQPHLPDECDDNRLERFLVRCRNSIEKTKASLDMYYTLKTEVPEILCDRDPTQPWFKAANDSVMGVPLPKLTPDCDRVLVCRFHVSDFSKITTSDMMKLGCLVQDIRMCYDYNICDIIILDFQNFTIGHTTKVSYPLFKKTDVCFSKAFQVRVKEIHFINTPGFIEVIMTIARSFLKPKLTERIKIHCNGLESLHERIPKDILPTEYGGDAGPLADMHNAWLKYLGSYRDWILKEEKLKSDESKRPGKKDIQDNFGFEGSFRTLTVD